MDISSITAAVQSLKAAGDIATAMLRLHSAAEIQPKITELNSQILEAQHKMFAANAAHTELLERNRELERQVARMTRWETLRERYGLAALSAGCMVYALKKDRSEGEPPHYLCATCFQKGEPSILQGRETVMRHYAGYVCPRRECGSVAATPWTNVIAPQYLEDIKPK